jgi:V-type H+-transporting ATPase subunit C
METHLIAVPKNFKKDFINSYETLAPMVVPRSSVEVDQDDEFVLFAVTTFKKHSDEFVHKCREQKWTPRNYKYVEGNKEEEQRELDRVTNDERKVCGEAMRMGRTGWSESVMVWMHVLTLRVFVEAVLRYGLPLDYLTALVKVWSEATQTRDEQKKLTASNRLRRSSLKRSREVWTANLPFWGATHSGETSADG